ncbi:MAG: RNA-binding domain-containing protein [Bacteroidota bacterium]
MKLEEALDIIKYSILSKTYQVVETEKIEIKDLSAGSNWKELYRTVNAFLNTEGGIVVIGIKEKNKSYSFTGYNPNNESKIKELRNLFTDEQNNQLDLDEYFPTFELRSFLDGSICIVYMEKLAEEEKYVYFKGAAYARKLTGDHKISERSKQQQRELKEEIKFAQELDKVNGSSLSDLNVDRLNDYIIRLNKDIKVESLKADIQSAVPFLSKKRMIREGIPSYLGMLVCGKDVKDFIGKRCEVDGYVEVSSNRELLVAENKQVIEDNIIQLMERSIGFIYQNIQVGVSYEKGGNESPEYPPSLIRETINNALAHRSYKIDNFVTISIQPNESLSITNPGSFREEQRIYQESDAIKFRRIIPIPKPKNPRLADVLKAFNRWEGRGIGMVSLANACLENKIDLPYYSLLHSESVKLTIPKGKILDEEMQYRFSMFSKYIYIKNNGRKPTEEEKTVLAYSYKSEKANSRERYTIQLTPDNNHFGAISLLEASGLIFKHAASPHYSPIYLIDRVLSQEQFDNKLRAIFGAFDALDASYKDILNVIYPFYKYSLEHAVSANFTGNYLYRKQHRIISSISEFEDFKKDIHYKFSQLEKQAFVVRQDDDTSQFIINSYFKRTPSIFDKNPK